MTRQNVSREVGSADLASAEGHNMTNADPSIFMVGAGISGDYIAADALDTTYIGVVSGALSIGISLRGVDLPASATKPMALGPGISFANFGDVSIIEEMQTEVQQLRARVGVLEGEVEALVASISVEDVIELRTSVSKEEAKKEIRELYASGETIYISEVAERLRLPDKLVVELCVELQNEGEIQVNESAY